jgi:anti-sigma B factor antagonist
MDPQSSLDVVRLVGELDVSRRSELATALSQAGGGRAVLIDLSAVSYIDSTVVAELLHFRNEADANGRPVAVLIGSQQLARVIEYAGLAHAFAVFDDRGRALTFLAGTSPT